MDVQKTMEFILEQQAASTVMINRLMEAQYNTEQNVSRLAASHAESDARLDRVEAIVEANTQGMQRFEEGMQHLREDLQHLTGRVDALVAVVDSLVVRPKS